VYYLDVGARRVNERLSWKNMPRERGDLKVKRHFTTKMTLKTYHDYSHNELMDEGKKGRERINKYMNGFSIKIS
jgi:hypothetical protein